MQNPVDQMTARWLAEAGIRPGMRVVDIGCGPGTVTFELARQVGPSGRVYGVDREPKMLELARPRCAELGLSNVAFIEAGFDLAVPDGTLVDAAVGRRVLMYQPDPVEAVRQLVRVVQPGGLVFFHEHDTLRVADPRASLPLHDQVRGWLHSMLRGEGARLNMGFDLHGVLGAAGLEVQRVCVEASVLTPTSHYPVSMVIRAVLPRLVRLGIVREADVDLDTLDQRLLDERRRTGATCLWELVFCAWARKAQ
jgi:SAM-dependent methyltransferase